MSNVVEIVDFEAVSGKADELASGLTAATAILGEDSECVAVTLHRGIENPARFSLSVEWTSVDAHEAWKETEAQASFVSHIIGLFEGEPRYAHYFEIAHVAR